MLFLGYLVVLLHSARDTNGDEVKNEYTWGRRKRGQEEEEEEEHEREAEIEEEDDKEKEKEQEEEKQEREKRVVGYLLRYKSYEADLQRYEILVCNLIRYISYNHVITQYYLEIIKFTFVWVLQEIASLP